MIHVIGNIAINISTQLDTPITLGTHNDVNTPPMLDLTGHGMLQAVSAARCGARVSLTSDIANDFFGEYILGILRKEGIRTSALRRNAAQNNFEILIESPEQETKIAHLKEILNATDTLPPKHFNARSLIVFSNDSPADDHFTNWLKTIKNNNARTMLCQCSNNNETLAAYADIIICDESLPSLPSNKNAYTITTKAFGTRGANAQKGDTTVYSLSEQKNKKGNTTSFDIFCGYFAACLQASLPFKRSLKIACNAATLSTQSHGAYNAIPYLGYLEDIVQGTTKEKSFYS